MFKALVATILFVTTSSALGGFTRYSYECRAELRLNHRSFLYDIDSIVDIYEDGYRFHRKPDITIVQLRNHRQIFHAKDQRLDFLEVRGLESFWNYSASQFGLNVVFNPRRSSVRFNHRLERHGEFLRSVGKCKRKLIGV